MSADPKAVVDSIVSKCKPMNTAAHYTILPVYISDETIILCGSWKKVLVQHLLFILSTG